MQVDLNNIPDNMRVGGGASSSSITPPVLAILLVSIVLIFVLPRKYVAVPFLLAIFLTPFGQQIYTAGAHFFVPRILVMCGLARMAIARHSKKMEATAGGFTSIDKVFLWWAILRAAATFLEFLDKSSIINQAGFLIDTLGGYFLLRFLIRDEEDVTVVVKTFAVIASVLAVTMINERVQGINVFGYLGGTYRLRSYETGLYDPRALLRGRSRRAHLAPCSLSVRVAMAKRQVISVWNCGHDKFDDHGCNLCVEYSSIGIPRRPFGHMHVATASQDEDCSLGNSRSADCLASVDESAGVDDYQSHQSCRRDFRHHRAMLIDMFVRHFSDWWLIGVQSTASWGWDLWDQANQFVAEGETGGLATFICFVLLVSWSFGRIGTACKRVAGNRKKEWMLWLMGCALFSYVVSFFGISFSDQSWFCWFAFLAMSCVTTTAILGQTKQETRRVKVTRMGSWGDGAAVAVNSEPWVQQ